MTKDVTREKRLRSHLPQCVLAQEAVFPEREAPLYQVMCFFPSESQKVALENPEAKSCKTYQVDKYQFFIEVTT